MVVPVAGDLVLPLSIAAWRVRGTQRRGRIGSLLRRRRGRGAAHVRLRLVRILHIGVDFEHGCGRRLQRAVAPREGGVLGR